MTGTIKLSCQWLSNMAALTSMANDLFVMQKCHAFIHEIENMACVIIIVIETSVEVW